MVRTRVSRRKILTVSVFGIGTFAASAVFGRTVADIARWTGASPAPRGFDGRRFLDAAERRCVEALTSRLIPSDDTGSGAREAGVADFIDNQLAGSYGRGERWYMKGPFRDGLSTQGYQEALAPAALYRSCLAALDRHCRENSGGNAFADLGPEEQDAVLARMEAGDLQFEEVSAKAFFSMLRANTIEGFFCDPIYGGNRDMLGWKLVGFPGARYDYRDFLDHNGAAILMEPVGLAGRPAWGVN